MSGAFLSAASGASYRARKKRPCARTMRTERNSRAERRAFSRIFSSTSLTIWREFFTPTKRQKCMTRNLMKKSDVKFAFFGTPELATVVLDALEGAGYSPALVVTTPDQKKNRGMKPTQSPVKQWAGKRGVETIAPETLDDAAAKILRSKNCDLFIVIYYGKVLPKEILDIPAHGTLNIHFSLLPRWRGTSPVRAAILNDDREIGTSIILLDEKIDHGPIVAQKKIYVPGWSRSKDGLVRRSSGEGDP